jgi:hypothetical protein
MDEERVGLATPEVDLFRTWLWERKNVTDVPAEFVPAWLEVHGYGGSGRATEELCPAWKEWMAGVVGEEEAGLAVSSDKGHRGK